MFDSSKLMYSSGGGDFYSTTIDGSLRFNDDDSAYLSRTQGSGNRKTYTFSGWVKRGDLSGVDQRIFSAYGGTSYYATHFLFADDDTLRFYSWEQSSASIMFNLRTTAVYRDTSAWYHIVLTVDTTQATTSDRVKLYVNGSEVTSFGTSSYPSLNDDTLVNISGQPAALGASPNSPNTDFLDGYITEVNFIDGTALDPTSFGEFKSGVWIPKAYEGSYGTNGFYLPLTSDANDDSGNGNNWTENNLASTDYVLDSPTNNFATLNPIVAGTHDSLMTYKEGNLAFTQPSSSSNASLMNAESTFGVSTGKWYWEYANLSNQGVGFSLVMSEESAHFPSIYAMYYGDDGGVYGAGATLPSSLATFTSSDIIGVAFDADNGTLSFYKNNSLQGTVTNIPANNTYVARTAVYTGSASGTGNVNFGQDSSFAGNKTAQGNTDDNGYGDFYYAPPSGYLALCTANLPDPVASIDPAQDGSPQDHFNTVLYTGNGVAIGSGGNPITGVGFQPDFTWIKSRVEGSTNYGGNHHLFDVVRGATKELYSNLTQLEQTRSEGLASFDADGFTLGNKEAVNFNSDAFVSWNWKANGSGVSNTDGSITSTVSANTDAGFSIVSYTGNGSGGTSGATIGHGLSATPELVIVKNRDTAVDWQVGSTELSSTGRLKLNSTDAEVTYSDGTGGAIFNYSSWNTNVFAVYGGDSTGVNKPSNDYIAYCFHSVDGFSKFGSYTGNGSTDGPFVYTGFRPAFVMWKRTDSTSDWFMMDDARDIDNPTDHKLEANGSGSEVINTAYYTDYLSNGFKLRNTNGQLNASGGTYIYMAFAENPFKYANAR
jgi:hypothetical protein